MCSVFGLRHGSNARDNFMKLSGSSHRAENDSNCFLEFGGDCFWTIRLSPLIEP